jgi:predicted S18 family serine protease
MRMTGVAAMVAIFGILFFLIGIQFELPSPTKSIETKIVYQTVIRYVNNTIEVPVGLIYEKNITVYGVAVFNNSEGGELVGISLFMKPGHGGILLDVSKNTFGADIQDTLPLIKSYAQAFTGKSLAYKDIIIAMDTQAENIQGTSGGAAIVIGLIAMSENLTLKDDIVISGVLQPDGTLGSVSSLDQKIAVADSLGVGEFLIPKVQCASVNESAIGNITVTCINTIREALEHMTA